jgi:hypothetical protein
MGFELYPENSNREIIVSDGTSLWPLTGGKEIDLRLEMQRFLFGSAFEEAKGQPGVLRRMRRDDNGDLIPCECINSKTREPDVDVPCEYCWSEGFLWDEEWVTWYKVQIKIRQGLPKQQAPSQPGIIEIPMMFFYVQHHVLPTVNDKIVEVELDVDGDVVLPCVRKNIYRIGTAEAFRSDNGRIEYWRIAVNRETVKSTWQG